MTHLTFESFKALEAKAEDIPAVTIKAVEDVKKFVVSNIHDYRKSSFDTDTASRLRHCSTRPATQR